MLAGDVKDEVAEVVGTCEAAVVFQNITRGVQMLANKGLIDPLIGTLNFANSDTNLVVMPRDVKTVLRCNVNGNPTFFRNRLFEFALNTLPQDDNRDTLGFDWADKGYVCINDERKLPGALAYVCEVADDVGKTMTVWGHDEQSREISETLVAGLTATLGTNQFFDITRIQRDTTANVCLLYCNGDLPSNLCAQYYPEETAPRYRVLKLSKKVANVRIMYRREVFEITSDASFIPMDSHLAVIHAAKATRLYSQGDYQGGDLAAARAVQFLREEQASRDENDQMASAMEAPSVTDHQINTRDSIIAWDVYDAACDIFGPLGMRKILDKITTALEALRNKTTWDPSLGVVDIYTQGGDGFNRDAWVNPSGGKGTGYFVLPRFVEAPIKVNFCGEPTLPRNKWFEFNQNGMGEEHRSSPGTWTDAGETCIIHPIPLDPTSRQPIAFKLICNPDDPADNGKQVMIYGMERKSTGEEVEIYRGGKPGWCVPQVRNSYDPGDGSPMITRIDRITREATRGFVRLLQTNGTEPGSLYGYFYPDEVEPKYRAIQVPTSKVKRIRVLYRRRDAKVTSLYTPIPLRSRLAVENMLRALKAQEGGQLDVAVAFESLATRYLNDERINAGPSDTPDIEFDPYTMPGFTGNIM